ncbi:MAG: proprotein convertase P-domain-containing protein [Bacteroidota bacterium]
MMKLAPLCLVFLAAAAVAQPASPRLGAADASVDVLTLGPLDNDALARRADAARRAGPAPRRFAEPVTVQAARRGTWDDLDDGTRVWRLVVASPGAYSLSFGFSQFRLPEGAALWIYPEAGAPEYRPFTADDNEDHGELWTPIVPGDRAVIELNVPASKGDAEAAVVELGQVNHAFRPTLLSASERERYGDGARRSGSCNVDVVCPQGDGFRDIIRSSGAYTVGGVDFCSGAAVNNTAQDDRPLFLTADHCGVGSQNAPQVVVYWNYQNSTCRPPGSTASGAPGDGSRAEFNSGTRSLGNGASSDWSILEFDDPILPTAGVYLAGWDRRDLAPSSVVAIHHPAVEEKRISFENDPTTLTTYASGTVTPNGTHIRVADWDLGTTEGGSSGSPLFNADKRIVGQLHGGGAACGNDEPDWYGRLHHSMDDGLAAVLDPGGTGAQTLDGKEYQPGVYSGAAASETRLRVGESATFTFTVGNPTDQALSGVQFTNPLPDGMALAGNLTASVGSASESGGTISWSGALGAGVVLTVSYDAVVTAGAQDGPRTNRATTVLGGGTPDLVAEVDLAIVSGRPAPDRVYTAEVGGSIPDNGCPTFSTTTIDVPDAFVVGRLSVGVGIEHTWRGDLRVRVTSPAGTTVSLIDRVGTGAVGSNADDLDVIIDDGEPQGAFSGGNHNTGEPFFDTAGAPEAGSPASGSPGVLASVIGEPAQGTWTLGVCDGAGQDTGSLERWSLQFVEAGPVDAEAAPAAEAFAVAVVGANPARGQSSVEVTVRTPQRVRVALVDASGREVRALGETEVSDRIRVEVDLRGLSAGTYFLRARGPEAVATAPLVVVR